MIEEIIGCNDNTLFFAIIGFAVLYYFISIALLYFYFYVLDNEHDKEDLYFFVTLGIIIVPVMLIILLIQNLFLNYRKIIKLEEKIDEMQRRKTSSKNKKK